MKSKNIPVQRKDTKYLYFRFNEILFAFQENNGNTHFLKNSMLDDSNIFLVERRTTVSFPNFINLFLSILELV